MTLRAAGWGRIVNIVSAVVFLGPPELAAYTTSNAGARERSPASSAGGPYMCARESGFLTGQTVNVNGGSAKH